ncbi:MAG TPA: hypothetical protein EYQ12_06465 [Oceanospirillaceae bacterium]|nr:hypothetical protein [Oceanospirillaceae bacterium]
MTDPSFALFIAVETCPEEPYYPIAAAWSLPDGSIKSSLILADDNWPPHLCYSDHLSDDMISAMGHSVKDVLLEMNDDLDACHVVGHGDFTPAQSLEHLVDALDIELSFELSTRHEDVSELLGDDWRDELQDLAHEMGLDLLQAEHQVRLMQLCWARRDGHL